MQDNKTPELPEGTDTVIIGASNSGAIETEPQGDDGEALRLPDEHRRDAPAAPQDYARGRTALPAEVAQRSPRPVLAAATRTASSDAAVSCTRTPHTPFAAANAQVAGVAGAVQGPTNSFANVMKQGLDAVSQSQA